MKHISAHAHLAGTPASKAVAEYAAGLLKEWGLDTRIEEFEALLPTPNARSLELLGPKHFVAKLSEPAISVDPTSSEPDVVPAFNAYSGSGDVTAPLIYANYGMPADYDFLAKNGIEVKGKIVITRYGEGWRGLKPRLAAEHGAVGCLIYSDPKDDGYYRGDAYPKGMWRPFDGVQRGSVADMTLYPGDPLTPGWAGEKDGRKLPLSEAKTLMKIPVIPISYGDALPLLKALDGMVAPEGWRGALGITYHIGNGETKARLKVEMDNSVHPLYNVIARIPGSEYPDQWILAGNHHDAWVNGAMDPTSGASSLLETARTLAELTKQGWKPKRTILLALWDGEEYGLVGSTEWTEKHSEELSQKLVAYINSDSNGKGRLGAGGSHVLETLVREVARDVNDPVDGKPLIENMRQRSRTQPVKAPGEDTPQGPEVWRLEALGSGSDYTSFLQHLGIASLNLGFGDENGSGGIYHSKYDSYYWYTHFADTNFVYGKALSQVTATTLMRLGDATLVPFSFSPLVSAIAHYETEIEKLEKARGKINLAALQKQTKDLERSSSKFDSAWSKATAKLDDANAENLRSLNQALFESERKLLLNEGLPGRPFFRHSIYAPGTLTGYGVKTLPGVREAIEGGRTEEAQQQAEKLVEVLRGLNQQVEQSTHLLNGL